MNNIKNTEVLYNHYHSVAPLGLIAMNGTQELGAKINSYLERWADRNNQEHDEFMIECECPRFQSGDAKGMIKSTVRGKDLFILVDVGNYNCKYNLFGSENSMSPDDHYMDLMRIIQAASGKPHRINVIMPLLYGGRQHRRSYRESLDCAVALQELHRIGVSNVITVDAHDPRVCNAVPLMGFDNIMPSYQVLKTLLKSFPDIVVDKEHFMVVSPDEGAMNRNMYYASVMGVDLGMCYKRRDYSTIVNGRNPIVAHEYLGTSVEGKDVFVADDIIASGESMLDIAREMKGRKAKRVFAYATYGMFTSGLDSFDKAYADGLIHKVFTTNLIYSTKELLSREWYVSVDVSKYCSYIIDTLNHDESVSGLLDPKDRIHKLLTKYGFESHITNK